MVEFMQMDRAMKKRWTSAGVGAVLVLSGAALVFGLGAIPFAEKSAGASAEVQLPAKTQASQRTALDLELVFGKGTRGSAVVVRHQPSGEVIGTVTPFGLGTDGGVGRFALTLPQNLEARLRRNHEPLKLELEAKGAASGAADEVVLRSVAPKLVPTAQ
jgi:hypothetical protein